MEGKKMNVVIEKDKILTTLPIAPRTSKSGKSLVIASTGGNQTTSVLYDGKEIVVGVNAYIKK